MKHILMITTGGTIASMPTPDGLAPGIPAKDLLSYLPTLSTICTIKTLPLCSIDSTDVNVQRWQQMARAIEENYALYDGFVLCHGTDTLAYTAAALSYMIQHSPKPIVLTGAQKPITAPDTDAVKNLTDSIFYACSDLAHDVCIVFGRSVIAGTRARKMYTQRHQAFKSINFPELAAVHSNKITPCASIFPEKEHKSDIFCNASAPQFHYNLSSRVCIFKLLPGMNPDIISDLFVHYDCILVEGYGMGGIPEHFIQPFTDCLNNYPDGAKILVMATQVPFEGTNTQRYAVGRRMHQKAHILELYDMTPEAAALKLMWLLGDSSPCKDHSQIFSRFYQPVNYDICPPISMLPD